MELQETKNLLRDGVVSYYDYLIQQKYSVQTQLNILIGVESGADNLKALIDKVVMERDALLAEVDGLASTEILETVSKGTDEDMAMAIGEYVDVTTEDQSLAMLNAITGLLEEER